MPIPPELERVPFDEVAAVLDETATQIWGVLPRSSCPVGMHLAAALDAAGFRVVREPKPSRQLTL
jgi:hypothetical protein